MKNIIDKYFHLICIAVVIIFTSLLIIRGYFSTKSLLRNPKYTTAIIVNDWHHKNDNGIGLDYEYFVYNKRYVSTKNLDLKKKQRYLLIFDSLKPKNHVLLDAYPINSSFSTPSEGWRIDELPIKVDTSKINKVLWGD